VSSPPLPQSPPPSQQEQEQEQEQQQQQQILNDSYFTAKLGLLLMTTAIGRNILKNRSSNVPKTRIPNEEYSLHHMAHIFYIILI
jgi:hypothetical protein